MPHHLSAAHSQALDVWLARAFVAGLQLLIINDLSVGPRWLAPTIELSLLVPLSIATAWNQQRVRRATSDSHWSIVARHRHAIRWLAAVLTAVVTILNFGAVIELVRALLAGGESSGATLLLDALNIWATNVIAFALWFWTIDRRGPAGRGPRQPQTGDFLFPQMLLANKDSKKPFSPGFVDDLFLSFTNATAFSPTDTMPLSQRAKLLMTAEAIISLLTVALVAARAVNILACAPVADRHPAGLQLRSSWPAESEV